MQEKTAQVLVDLRGFFRGAPLGTGVSTPTARRPNYVWNPSRTTPL